MDEAEKQMLMEAARKLQDKFVNNWLEHSRAVEMWNANDTHRGLTLITLLKTAELGMNLYLFKEFLIAHATRRLTS